MPNPKRRWSKARKRKRQGHHSLTAPQLVSCPRCFEMRRSHRVCPKCGYYGETSVIQPKEE